MSYYLKVNFYDQELMLLIDEQVLTFGELSQKIFYVMNSNRFPMDGKSFEFIYAGKKIMCNPDTLINICTLCDHKGELHIFEKKVSSELDDVVPFGDNILPFIHQTPFKYEPAIYDIMKIETEIWHSSMFIYVKLLQQIKEKGEKLLNTYKKELENYPNTRKYLEAITYSLTQNSNEKTQGKVNILQLSDGKEISYWTMVTGLVPWLNDDKYIVSSDNYVSLPQDNVKSEIDDYLALLCQAYEEGELLKSCFGITSSALDSICSISFLLRKIEYVKQKYSSLIEFSEDIMEHKEDLRNAMIKKMLYEKSSTVSSFLLSVVTDVGINGTIETKLCIEKSHTILDVKKLYLSEFIRQCKLKYLSPMIRIGDKYFNIEKFEGTYPKKITNNIKLVIAEKAFTPMPSDNENFIFFIDKTMNCNESLNNCSIWFNSTAFAIDRHVEENITDQININKVQIVYALQSLFKEARKIQSRLYSLNIWRGKPKQNHIGNSIVLMFLDAVLSILNSFLGTNKGNVNDYHEDLRHFHPQLNNAIRTLGTLLENYVIQHGVDEFIVQVKSKVNEVKQSLGSKEVEQSSDSRVDQFNLTPPHHKLDVTTFIPQ